jgi:hypothetical protein
MRKKWLLASIMMEGTHSVLMRGMSGSGVTGRRWFTGLCVSWMNSRLSVFEKNLHIRVRFTI